MDPFEVEVKDGADDDTAVELCVFVQGKALDVLDLSRGAHCRLEPHVHDGVPGLKVTTTDEPFYFRLIEKFHKS